jgi:hypothetical protein
MKEFFINAGKKIITSAITAFFIMLFLYAGYILLPKSFPANTPTTTPPTVSPSPNTQSSPLTYDSALSTYELIAARSIEASERALNIMISVFSVIMGLTAIASGLAVYLYKTTNEASKQAQLAQEAAELAKNAADKASTQLVSLSEKYIELNKSYISLLQQSTELRATTYSIETALQAADLGEITPERVMETQQWYSWHKWTNQGNKLGWNELVEHASSGIGLVTPIRVAIEIELGKLLDKGEALTPKEVDKKSKLTKLRDIRPEKI